MSLSKLLNATTAQVEAPAAAAWEDLEMEQDLVASGVEQITVALSALEQIDDINATLNQILEIEDPAAAKLALTAALASENYSMLRPSMESTEDSAKDDTKGVIQRMIDAAVSVVQKLYQGLIDFIKGIFDRNQKISNKAKAFAAKAKDLKGEPKEAKVTLPEACGVLFNGTAFDEKLLEAKTAKTLVDGFNAAKADAEKGEKSAEDIDKDIVAAVAEIMHKDGKAGEVNAMKASDIITASATLSGDSENTLKLRTGVFDKATKEIADQIKEIKAAKGDDAKEQVAKCKEVSRVISVAAKSLLSAAAMSQTAKLSALVTFAKNIEEAK